MSLAVDCAARLDQPLSSFAFGWAQTRPEAAALLLPGEGAVTVRTWRELADDVLCMTAHLHGLGVAAGDRVVFWCDNRYEWIVVDLAIIALGAIHVPLHGSLTPAAAALQIAHAEPKLLLAATPAMLEGLRRHPESLPAVHGLALALAPAAAGASLLDRSREFAAQAGRELADRAAAAFDADAIATILYSSGTSGEPKAVALTHANLLTNCQAIVSAFAEAPDERRLNFLPFSHIYARTCDLYAWLAAGSQLALARNRETVLADCAAVAPTMMNGVPFFYDRLMQRVAEAERSGSPLGLPDLLGPRIRLCICGGAPLAVDTFDFFHQRGMPLLAGYGLTESSPVISMSTPDAFRRGTVGRPISGIDVRVAADGELLTRGPHVMKEYWRNPELTRETIRDGWLYTGDLGAIDQDGFIAITGRKKELLALSTGKKAVPTYIESLLCREPAVHQAMVVGNDRPYLAAILTPNLDELRRRLQPLSPADAGAVVDPQSPAAVELYRAAIARQLRDLPACEQVKRFLLVDRPFTVDEGLLTPKMSLRRDAIHRAFEREIGSLYEGGGVAVSYDGD